MMRTPVALLLLAFLQCTFYTVGMCLCALRHTCARACAHARVYGNASVRHRPTAAPAASTPSTQNTTHHTHKACVAFKITLPSKPIRLHSHR